MSGAKSFNPSSRKRKSTEDNNQPLHGFNVCTSGFSPIENKLIKTKIENLGGCFCDNLLSTTHYLIINKINTDKAITAVQYNIKLVTKEWIDENSSDKYLDYEKCTPGCFYGINLFLFGFNEEELKIMKFQISQKDGEIFNNADEADIIIVKSDSGYVDEEIEKLKKFHHKTVTEKWYEKCLTKNEYKKIDENEDLLNIEVIKNNYKKVITEIESGQNTKYINLFIGRIFGVQGFKNEIKNKIIEMISFCNGFYFDTILESTNYVIVPLTFDNINIIQNKANIFGIGPTIVTCNWLFNTIKEGILLPPDIYKPIKSFDIQKTRTNNQKILYLGDTFKGQSFSICNSTYKQDKINEIKEKIVQNMGEYYDSGNTKEIIDFKAKFIVLNDGYPETWNKLITENVEKQLGKIIISHRFLDECLRMRKIIECTDFFDSVPYPFAVPLEEFKNRYFYLPPNQFSLQERFCYDHLIETFGGNVDDLSEKTTHILFKKEEISQRTRDKMIKGSNKNVKFIKEGYFTDYILQSGACDINKYQVKIKVK